MGLLIAAIARAACLEKRNFFSRSTGSTCASGKYRIALSSTVCRFRLPRPRSAGRPPVDTQIVQIAVLAARVLPPPACLPRAPQTRTSLCRAAMPRAAFLPPTSLPPRRPRLSQAISPPRAPLRRSPPPRTPHAPHAPHTPHAPARMHTTNPRQQPLSPPLRLPALRPSARPLSSAVRLSRVASGVGVMYLPAAMLLPLRALQPGLLPPLPAAHRLLLAALVVIAPQLRRSSLGNLRACAAVARRVARRPPPPPAGGLEEAVGQAAHKERLALPVQVHSVLTAVTAAGTLSGLYCALVAPPGGAQITLLFQTVFYLGRRVRFEREGKVYRCDRAQYADIVLACMVASACVAAVQLACVPTFAAGMALFLACAFWVLKWIFVPSSATVF